METDILETLLQDLIEERLNKIIQEDEEYCRAAKVEEKSYDKLENMLTADQQEMLEDFISTKVDTEIIVQKAAYVQGMKDMYTLFRALS